MKCAVMLICDISAVTCKIHDGKYIQFKSGTMKSFTSTNIKSLCIRQKIGRLFHSMHSKSPPSAGIHAFELCMLLTNRPT